MSDEEDFLLWQDILDEIAAGRQAGHVCPFCAGAEIQIEQEGKRVRVFCPKCRKFVEGAIGSAEG